MGYYNIQLYSLFNLTARLHTNIFLITLDTCGVIMQKRLNVILPDFVNNTLYFCLFVCYF